MASRDGVFPRFNLSFMLLYGMPGVKMHAHPRSPFFHLKLHVLSAKVRELEIIMYVFPCIEAG